MGQGGQRCEDMEIGWQLRLRGVFSDRIWDFVQQALRSDENFKQGSDMIRSAFWTDSSGCRAGNRPEAGTPVSGL